MSVKTCCEPQGLLFLVQSSEEKDLFISLYGQISNLKEL